MAVKHIKISINEITIEVEFSNKETSEYEAERIVTKIYQSITAETADIKSILDNKNLQEVKTS